MKPFFIAAFALLGVCWASAPCAQETLPHTTETPRPNRGEQAPRTRPNERDGPQARIIAAEAHYILLDGPAPGEKRGVSVWRPPNTQPSDVLSVIYMADGVIGLNVVTPRLREAILAGRAPPIMVVAFASSLRHRHDAYVAPAPGQSSVLFDQHEAWFLNTLLPWAERVAGASPDPIQRAVAGFSNGADFALATAALHPDRFGAVLAHSPVLTRDFHLDNRAARIRWAVSGGRDELGGAVVRVADMVGDEARAHGGPVRRCVGPWLHRAADWREVSAGSIAWLFEMAQAREIASHREEEYCRELPPLTAPQIAP